MSLARVFAIIGILAGGSAMLAQSSATAKAPSEWPWSNKTLSPDRRAEMVIGQMTLDEKLKLISGSREAQTDARSLGGAGFVPPIDRLGSPSLQMTNGRTGLAQVGRRGRYATALPSSLACGATWDLKTAYDYGALMGKEIRDVGFNVSLGGTANLIRDPRNGRNFECWGEDPILIGKMLGRALKGTQDQGVIANINRFAINDQETGRRTYNVPIGKRAFRETDLLAFEIAIRESDVGTVMCAYNKVNGDYACESSYLMNDLLKKSWGYRGWVMTDWNAIYSAPKAALAGLDQEMPWPRYFDDKLKSAITAGEVPVARVDDMVRRILRTMFAFGLFDEQPAPRAVDPFAGAQVAQRVAEQSIVLLKNDDGLLPLRPSVVKSIAVIGSHADVGVLSGGGSDQVDPAGGNPVPGKVVVWHPSSPLKAIREHARNAKVQYDPGTDPASAAKVAAGADVAIVFASQHTAEGRDVADMSLPDDQDKLIAAVAAKNPRTIVVLETGSAVKMPWVGNVAAVLAAWYPGIRGGEAIANILFGAVNPSAKLPVTFPKNEEDLPHPALQTGSFKAGAAGTSAPNAGPPFDVVYTEELKTGYKWFDATDRTPLFPFGFGLSYTTFSYAQLTVSSAPDLSLKFVVRNTGKRAGAEIAQVYVSLPPSAKEPPSRLVAWSKVELAAGEAKTVSLKIDRSDLAIFSEAADDWELLPGDYHFHVGGSSRSTPLSSSIRLAGR